MSFSSLGSVTGPTALNFDTANFLTTALAESPASVSGPNGVLTFTSAFGGFDVGTVTTVLMAGATPANDATNIYVDAPNDGGGNPQHYAIAKAQTIGQIFFAPFDTLLSNDFGAGGADPTLGSIFGQTALDLIAPSISANLEGTNFGDVMTLPAIGGFLDGNAGNDSLTGSSDIDSIVGGSGDDTINGGGSGLIDYDTLVGGTGADQITAIGFGIIQGGDDDDTIIGVSSGDVNFGDFVIASFIDAPAGIFANLTSTVQGGVAAGNGSTFFISDGYGHTDNIQGVHVVEGSDNNDTFLVDTTFINDFGNWVEFMLMGGDDVVAAVTNGTARVSYRFSDGPLFADLELGTATDLVMGAGVIGNDTFTGTNEFLGSRGNDQIFGANGDDKRIRGNDGDDFIDGREGNNRLDGEDGNDTLIGGTDEDTLNGGEGDDSLEGGGASSGAFDNLRGQGGNDFMLITGLGVADGGAGQDTVRYVSTGDDFAITGHYGDPTGIIANLTATLQMGVAGGDNVSGFHVLDGFGDLDNVQGVHAIAGSDHNDFFYIDGTYDTSFGNYINVRPRGGDDTIILSGGVFARISYRNENAAVLADLEAGTATDLTMGATDIGSDTFAGLSQFRGSRAGDSIDGSLGDDNNIDGFDGNDTINGLSGDDRLNGDAGNDVINGGSGSDNISGGEGNDTLMGGGAVQNEFDFINGGNGADFITITGFGGVDGGAGDDNIRGVFGGNAQTGNYITVEYASAPSGILANLTSSTQMGVAGGDGTSGYSVRDGYGDTDNVAGMNAMRGSTHNDQFFVDAAYVAADGNAVEFRPGQGDDTVTAIDGAFFGVVYDDLNSGVLLDMAAGTGTDLIPGTGIIGNDTFAGVGYVRGTTGDDSIFGTNNDDGYIDGSGGNDYIDGRDGNDNLYGDDGNDTLIGGDGSDDLRGGDGDDSIDGSMNSVGGFDELWGGNGNDILNITGDGRAAGEDGNDTLRGISAGDNGNNDFAQLVYENSPGGIIANLTSTLQAGLAGGSVASGYLVNDGHGDQDNVSGFHAFNGSNNADQIFVDGDYINSFGNWIEVRPLGGNDQITFIDVAVARVSYRNADGPVLVDMELGTATDLVMGAGNIGNDTFTGANQLRGSEFGDQILGAQSGNERLRGHNGEDLIDGRGGDDELQGENDNDTLLGGAGIDTLEGGDGADSLDGGDDVDWAAYYSSDARVEINLSLGTGNGGQATGDTLVNIENIFGSGFNDLLVGDAAANEFNGFGGVDNMNGRGGDDLLFGQEDDDLISGGSGNDTLGGDTENDRLAGNGGADEIYGGQGVDSMFGGVGNDFISGGTEGDSALGQGNSDTIFGDEGNDTLRGGSGNDSIDGGSDDDLIFGNGNNDTISGGSGDDTIQGASGSDQLFGNEGNDTLTGSNGGDLLDGGTGNDVMNGGGADGARDTFVFLVGYEQDRINAFDQIGNDRLQLDQNLWLGTAGPLSEQDVIDTFGTLNTAANILTLDFGGGDVLEVQNSAGIDATTMGLDVVFV